MYFCHRPRASATLSPRSAGSYPAFQSLSEAKSRMRGFGARSKCSHPVPLRGTPSPQAGEGTIGQLLLQGARHHAARSGVLCTFHREDRERTGVPFEREDPLRLRNVAAAPGRPGRMSLPSPVWFRSLRERSTSLCMDFFSEWTSRAAPKPFRHRPETLQVRSSPANLNGTTVVISARGE